MNRIFSQRIGTRYQLALGIVTALTGIIGTAYAQRPAPVVKPVSRRQPVPIFRLDTEDAAPTRAELQNRVMKSLATNGRKTTQKGNGVIEFQSLTQEQLNAMMTPEQKKAAEEKAKQKAAEKKKKATEKKQAEEDAKIQAAVEKALADAEASKFNVLLSAKQTETADGNAYVNFMAPLFVSVKDNLVAFQNKNEYKQSAYWYGTLFVPESFMVLGMQIKAGKSYLVTADVLYAALNGADESGIWIYEDWYNLNAGVLPYNNNNYLLNIGSGVRSTSFVVKSDKEGWYTLYFAGLSNKWEFRGLTIKEITP